ncbi:MAG: heavy-metal-associated domain-containing protein [Planctomycetota bacterium]
MPRLPIWLRLTAAGLVLLAAGFAWQGIEESRRTPAEDAPRIEFDVDGLDCPFWCAVRLTESIDGLDGAIVERLDQKGGTVTVRHDPTRQGAAKLRRLLDARGFAVQDSRAVGRAAGESR